MTVIAVAVLLVLLLGWALVAGALERRNITGPIVFTFSGYVLANPNWGPLSVDIHAEPVHLLAEVALVLVLFSDAARVSLTSLRTDMGLPVRLLGIGLPLTMILGGVIAAAVFSDLTWALAGFVGAALAPTDAALSAQVIADGNVPSRLRQALNVESGLNDGIATPIVVLMLSIAAVQLNISGAEGGFAAGTVIRELGLGALAGAALGVGGALAVNIAVRRHWMLVGGRRIATLAVALAAFAVALAIDGNGFIAAFVAGICLGSNLDKATTDIETEIELPELGGQVLASAVWFLFGGAAIPIAIDHLDVDDVAYAVLSLTAIRMVPVALAMVHSGLDRTSVLFLGWFGPRGLASVVFALLAVEELDMALEPVRQALGVVVLTILFSVILHGISAGVAGRRYARTGHVENPQPER